ncbi:Glycosyltransferase [Furfurilactobacillus rossiae]|uniref:glycosyltransferase n=1 Tax=Furfurilactobacillus rossiae TaxID=231049 RepID=UPI0015BE5482|nr:glycosyltransferase [Furfurilactobacillus rossiae]MCF6165359.1 glycosyltransferase [Furfurilactobacillus rossiae]QLE63719.1 Glycosyltransferase [Furfurilactobacillus rossiae]
MDLLILTPFMNGYGGTEKVIANFCDAFATVDPQNVNLKVIDFGGTVNDAWARNRPVEIVNMAKNRRIRNVQYALTLYSKISRVLRNQKFDFVVSTNPLMWSMAYEFCKRHKLRTKVIAWYHYSLERKPIRNVFLKRADYYFAISTGIKKELMDAGISPARVKLIFNPVESVDRPISRSKASNRFVYLGRTILDGQKNIRELLVSLSKLNADLDWHLDLYGDGEDRDEAPRLAKKLGINDHLTWHGFVENPWSKITVADVLLLTSTYEGFPMVLIEGASRGLFLISSDCPTGPSDIVSRQNGTLYPLGDVNSLSKKITNIIEHKDQLPSQDQIRGSVHQFQYDEYVNNVVKALQEMEKVNG